MQITPGRIVVYRLSEQDASFVRQFKGGGNFYVHAGDEFPLVAVRIWPHEWGQDRPGVNGQVLLGVNGQVLLDGAATLWVTSVREGTEPGTWHWPTRQ